MKKRKAMLTILLSVSLAALCACGAKNAEPQEVEVDFTGMTVTADSVSSAEEMPDVVHNGLVGGMKTETSSDSSKSYNDPEAGEGDDDSEMSEEHESLPYEPKEIPGQRVDISWYDDCVFMGDSVTNGLNLYNDASGCCGNAQFICAGSLGWVNCQWELDHEDEVHPVYMGQKVRLEDAPGITGAKKCIIGLGMNDIGLYGVDGTIDAVVEFIMKLKSKYPGLEIYIQTVTPMIEEMQFPTFNNELVKEYNAKLRTFCNESGCHYLDTWSALANEHDALPYELCADPEALGLHLKNEGSEIMNDYIMKNVN